MGALPGQVGRDKRQAAGRRQKRHLRVAFRFAASRSIIGAIEPLILAFVVIVVLVVAAPQPLREIALAAVWIASAAFAVFAAGAWAFRLLS